MNNITKLSILIMLVGLFSPMSNAQAQFTVPADDPTGCVNSYGQYGTQANKAECETNPNNRWHAKGTETKIPKEIVPECTGKQGEDTSKCCPKYIKDEALVQCGRKISCEYQVTGKDANGNPIKQVIRTADPKDSCGFDDLIHLIDRIITYILTFLAIPIAAIMFVYAGILLITSGGDSGAKTKAKNVLLDAVIGLVLAFAAFLIIKLLFSVLGYTGGGWIGF